MRQQESANGHTAAGLNIFTRPIRVRRPHFVHRQFKAKIMYDYNCACHVGIVISESDESSCFHPFPSDIYSVVSRCPFIWPITKVTSTSLCTVHQIF